MNQFNLNNQFHLYLQRVGLSVDSMSTEQLTETCRAFMGACGQMLDLLSEGMIDIPEDKGVAILEELFEQVEDFWNNEINSTQSNDVIIIDDQDAINFPTLFQKIKDRPKE